MLCGIDEAGRGCWAGPVVAAAVVFRDGPIDGLADSKKLTARQREALFPLIQARAWWAVGIASALEIDEVNILQATYLAMRRAFAGLPGLPLKYVIVDGNRNPRLEGVPSGCEVQTVVKADSTVAEVSAASILAKVTRDRLLAQLDTAYPGYGFAVHRGYGVPAHTKALLKLGPCFEHRKTFAPIKALL